MHITTIKGDSIDIPDPNPRLDMAFAIEKIGMLIKLDVRIIG